MDSLFSFLFLFFLTMARQVLERKIALLHVPKNRDKFLVSCAVKFPAIKKVIMISDDLTKKEKKPAHVG